MVKLTPTQLKAIGWYAEVHGLIPQLSTPPLIVFKERGSDVERHRQVDNLVGEYRRSMKEAKKGAKK